MSAMLLHPVAAAAASCGAATAAAGSTAAVDAAGSGIATDAVAAPAAVVDGAAAPMGGCVLPHGVRAMAAAGIATSVCRGRPAAP